MTNVLFIIVEQSKADDFKLVAARVSAKYPFPIQVVPALSSELKCDEDAYAICVEAGCGVLKEMARSLRGFAVREISILVCGSDAPLDGDMVRLVKFEKPQTSDDVQDALSQAYGEVGNCTAWNATIFVYAKDKQVTTLLVGKNQPNEYLWQKNVGRALLDTPHNKVFKDAWLFVV